MEPSGNTASDLLACRLQQGGRLRVWSLIITIFGDAVVPRGGVIALSDLREITNGLGIAENALRTAMSRLAADGWVLRHRHGRNSYYGLTPTGSAAFDDAEQRIYSCGEFEWDERFEVIVRPDDDHQSRSTFRQRMRQEGFGSPLQNMYVRPLCGTSANADAADESLRLAVETLSAESREELVMRSWPIKELAGPYQNLEQEFSKIREALQVSSASHTLDCLLARILLIHEWRRLVLRDVFMPDRFRSEIDQSKPARRFVREFYGYLFGPSEAFLDQCRCAPDRRLPERENRFARRFA